jgi:hypothetical protein
MEKTNPPCPLTVAGEEEEKLNPQYKKKTWHGETLIQSTRKTIDLYSLGRGSCESRVASL